MNKWIGIGRDKHLITGRKKTPRGYIACCIKSHPYAGKDNYVFEHRLVMEQELGRYLEQNECVHHINGIKADNRKENLQVMDHGEHTALTHKGLKRSASTKRKISIKTRERFRDKRNHPFYTDIPKSEMIAYYRNIGATKTAKKYGVTRRVIYNRLHEWGVPLNNVE